MRKTGKRLLALCLILCALCAYLAPGISAADSLTDLQQAIVETAKAYYYKGPYVQYDSSQMTSQYRLAYGESRLSPEPPPEWAADDNTLFTVCSNYAYWVVYNALGYKLLGGSRKCITRYLAEELDPNSTPGVIFHTGGDNGTYDPEAAVASFSLLQPGDVVTYYNKNKSTGHAVVYVGDIMGDGYGIFLNAGGSKINLKTGLDAVESASHVHSYGGGSIRLDGTDVQFYGKGTYADVSDPSKVTAFSIIRPALVAQELGMSMTPAAKTRMQFRGIDVDRTTSVKKYNSVQNGDRIGVTVTVTNHGKSDFRNVSVKEALPLGGAIDAASVKGGMLGADGITASLNVPAGGKATVEYTVTVTAKRGETVAIPAGSVENLTTRPLEFRVGGKALDSEALTELRTSSGLRKVRNLKYHGDLDFANAFYKEFFGVDLGLPQTIQEFKDTQLQWTDIPGVSDSAFGGQMLWAKKGGELTGNAKRYREMILPDHMAGYGVYLRDTVDEVPETAAAQNRVLEIKMESYQPGDIFFGYEHESGSNRNVHQPELFIYIGGKNAIGFTDGAAPNSYSFDKSIGLLLREDVLFALRPTLAYDDISSVKTVSFPDVKESDWFYSYVTDLAKDGIVGGMSDGTFRPAGTLTYGQALKLLICALDKDVGNAASGHWASNYLSAAQSKGWISADFLSENLDAWVSRLAFCQIAAKAKGLTEQPESNPFTDTSDPAVLALNKAGVIGGMGEGIFSPNTTLTRAQISKIIVELRKV